MKHLSTASQGCPIAKLRFHPRERLLASVAGPHAEVCVWGWDEAGALECLTRIQREGPELVRDLAWHPRGDALALVTGGRPIELWSVPVGTRIGEYGNRPASPEPVANRGARKSRSPVEETGYWNVIFSTNGDLLVAGSVGDQPTEVYRVDSGASIGTFWSSDTTFALHPEGEILATLCSDQASTAVRFGRLTDAFQGYNAQLDVVIDGYQRLVFSPKGDAFAVMGHAYGIGVRIYEFPSCRSIFEVDFEEWEDVWGRLWEEYRGSQRFPAKPDGSYPYDFVKDLWTVNDRLAFHPDGRSLFFGTIEGLVVAIDLSDTSKPSAIWRVHDGPALALDVSAPHGLLATARSDGELKLWKLDGSPATPDTDAKSLTRAFLEMFEPVDSTATEDQFRMTDGRRWYDLETLGEEELDEDDDLDSEEEPEEETPLGIHTVRWMDLKEEPNS